MTNSAASGRVAGDESCISASMLKHQWFVAAELTPADIGDASVLPELLDQVGADIPSMTADGAGDGGPVYNAVAALHPTAAVVIPPRATTVPGQTATTHRDRHLAAIEEHGRIVWQRRSG